MKTGKRTVLLLLMIFSLAAAQGRDTQAFNDGWLFKKGPFTADPILFMPRFDSDWKAVTLPHTWNARDMQERMKNYYTGAAYYRKSYTPDSGLANKRIFLRFEGVGSVAEVYVNRAFAGSHQGAYSAFAVEITDLVKYGEENEILVKVDNTPRPDVIPVNNTLFGVYGGIYRPVQLIVTEKINIAVTDYAAPGVYISQRKVSAKAADIEVKVKLENKSRAAKDVQLKSLIYDREGRLKASKETAWRLLPQGRPFVTQDFNLPSPHLWQGLEDPYIYKVVVQLYADGQLMDEVIQPLGIRHFELKTGDGMYLNGKKVPMYGVCRHQDWWQKGSALSKKEHDTDLALIREIGATTIRLAHYQQAEEIYAQCDSIGFMVWAEIPFVNRVTTQEADNAKQQLTELIRQNYNHPSIYIWGLHNEVYTPYNHTIALTTTLNDLAKTEDPYRYTVSVNGHNTIDQQSNLNADVQGINHYFGWYGGRIGDIERWVSTAEKQFPDYKVIFSEYGAEANIDQQEEVVGEVGRYFSQFYPETFATKFHEIQWGVISKHPYLLASYVWNMFDFATPETTQGGVESRNMKGLVTFDRQTRKDPFYWYKANWSKEPVLYITQRRATNRKNEITPITVYSNVGAPTLTVNGQPQTAHRMGTTAVHYIFDNIRLAEGENSIEVSVKTAAQTFTDRATWSYHAAGDKKQLEQPKERTNEHIGL